MDESNPHSCPTIDAVLSPKAGKRAPNIKACGLGMNGTTADNVGNEPAVPLDSIPIPVVGYSVRDGTVFLKHANRAFDAAFGECEPETPVHEWWDSNAITSDVRSVAEFASSLRSGERIKMKINCECGAIGDRTRTYWVQSRPESPSDRRADGYLSFTGHSVHATDELEVDRIASVISHELRNPLDVAKAHLQAARERGGEEHFEQLADAHDRMEQIIRDVLTLARKDDAITPSPGVELTSVATDAWATVDTATVSLVVEDDLPTIEADNGRLQRLFENLFRNSIEHAQPTGSRANEGDGSATDPELVVRVGPTGDNGFFVADNGVGIPAEERERAFEPGYSSDDSGIGLGLAIVEQIAEAHGWTVSLGAEKSGGARFEIADVETS